MFIRRLRAEAESGNSLGLEKCLLFNIAIIITTGYVLQETEPRGW